MRNNRDEVWCIFRTGASGSGSDSSEPCEVLGGEGSSPELSWEGRRECLDRLPVDTEEWEEPPELDRLAKALEVFPRARVARERRGGRELGGAAAAEGEAGAGEAEVAVTGEAEDSVGQREETTETDEGEEEEEEEESAEEGGREWTGLLAERTVGIEEKKRERKAGGEDGWIRLREREREEQERGKRGERSMNE
jgi:hypothetical protein